jgi:hypothetical protein
VAKLLKLKKRMPQFILMGKYASWFLIFKNVPTRWHLFLYSILFPVNGSTSFGWNIHPSSGARINCSYSIWQWQTVCDLPSSWVSRNTVECCVFFFWCLLAHLNFWDVILVFFGAFWHISASGMWFWFFFFEKDYRKLLGLLDSENEGSVILWNVRNCLCNKAA